jgi:hypothetical protein
MISIIKWTKLKEIAKSNGLRFSRSCVGKLDNITNKAVEAACKKAKEKGDSQLHPEHFDN